MAAEHRHRAADAACVLTLLGLTLAMFGDVLLAGPHTVLSSPGADIDLQFVDWRAFGFGELRQGNLPLWNPHVFSGAPYFAGFQSALLYPLNFPFLIFSTARAININIALHVFLGGLFMFVWARHRGLHPLAALCSGALFMFSGPFFLHVFGGHLPHLCTMIWAPLLFFALDGFLEHRSLGWGLLGALIVAMMLLAGHPQYAFYTAVAALVYCGLSLLRARDRGRALAGLAGMCAGGAGLAAVQVLAGVAATSESVRSIGLSFNFAASLSFPPENLLTFLAPGIFGDRQTIPYWGRWVFWEMCIFIGVTGFALALIGLSRGARVRRFSLAMALILLLLALGNYTPLFAALFHAVPGFDKFRCVAKFIFLVDLFLILAAGIGLDHLLRARVSGWRPGLLVLAAGALSAGAGLLVQRLGPGGWQGVMAALKQTNEPLLRASKYQDPQFIQAAANIARDSLWLAGGTLAVLALLLLLARRWPWAVYGVAVLAVMEVFIFARHFRETFTTDRPPLPEMRRFLAAQQGDFRMLKLPFSNHAMALGSHDLWGFDPGVLLRYAQFMAFSQGKDPDKTSQYVNFRRYNKLYEMLRLRYIFIPHQGTVEMKAAGRPMARLQLIYRHRVIADRDSIFAAMKDPDFNPRAEVILEREPQPKPEPGAATGRVKVVGASTDHLDIEADLPAAAIMLITDTYSEHWKARALEGSSQQRYQLLPANYVLRAIPLARGKHRLRVEYLPRAFVAGKWISLCSITGYLALLGWWWWRRKRR